MFTQNILQLLDVLPGQVMAWESTVPGPASPQSTSLADLVATLIPTFITAVIFLIAFLALRRPYRNLYTPRTYMAIIPEKDQTPSSGPGWFDWVHEFWAVDDKFILRHQSLDGYLFLRFFKMMVVICLVGCCITWPILFPVNATGGGTATQLDRISFSNVKGKDVLWAHAIIAWIYLVFVMVVVARERVFFIGLRQAYLLSKSNAGRLSSKTVLFLSAPPTVLHEDGLRRVFGKDAIKSWPVTRLENLEKLVNDRNDTAMMLEGAEVELSKNANQKRLAELSKHASSNGNHPSDDDYSQWMDEKSRPTHRTIPLVGQKVDTIRWSRQQLSEMTEKVQELRESHKAKGKRKSTAVFVQFASQAAAQQAHQQLPSHLPLQMNPRYIGVLPREIIWQNLCIEPPIRILRGYIGLALIIATTLFWSIPVGFVGAISNINYLAENVKFLGFIKDMPAAYRSLLTGLLPPLAISSLVSFVPIIFRYIALLSGEPTLSQAEQKTQSWYFIFQVIQVFLITTLSSGAAAVASSIAQEPTKIPTLLAENLPKASNFYLTYLILQGTTLAASNVLRYSTLLIYIAYEKLLNKTPRAKYDTYTTFQGVPWGALYPKFTNLAVIAITYSCIAPLVLGFATIGLWFLYLSYRYNLIFVVKTGLDTKGECYARALQHLLAGVYLAELCLLGLFGIGKATGPSLLIGILLVGTVLYHYTMDRLLKPLELYLPSDLQVEEDESTPLLAAEEGRAEGGTGEQVADEEGTDEEGTAKRGTHEVTAEEVPTEEESPAHPQSRIQALGEGWIPAKILDPLARFLEPHVFSSAQALKPWLRDSTTEVDEFPNYTQEEIENAYLNPVLTSKTPKLWLVRDKMGISKHEVEENDAAGIAAADDAAMFDKDNNILWDEDDLAAAPIFKRAVNY